MRKNLALLRKKVGSVFVTEPIPIRFWRAVEKKGASECWEWMGCRHYKGYGEFALPKGSPKYKEKAHRMAWILTNGKIPKGMLICHKCDNPPCCNPSHLFLGTAKTNRQDSNQKWRHSHGDNHPASKLNAAKVSEIRRLDRLGKTRLSIAAKFGISGRNVTAVCRYDNWKHVP